MTIELKNPHSVLAALAARPADVVEVRLSGRNAKGAWAEVEQQCASAGVPLRRQHESGGRGRGHDAESGRSPGAVGVVRERTGVSLEELFAPAAESRGTWLALDRLQDPHNVGAIFRSASFFGVRGVVLTRNQSAPLSGTVYDVASGGIEHVPFTVVSNLARTLEQSRQSNLWVLGTSERTEEDLAEVDRERNWLVVIGNEEKGLRRLTLKNCDAVCRIAPRGPTASLNASVATAVVLAMLERPAD